jgi:hypothetical protein
MAARRHLMIRGVALILLLMAGYIAWTRNFGEGIKGVPIVAFLSAAFSFGPPGRTCIFSLLPPTLFTSLCCTACHLTRSFTPIRGTGQYGRESTLAIDKMVP